MKNGKKVLCITTGEIHNSVKQAADAHHMKYASVHAVCYGRMKTHNQMQFCYLEDAPYRIVDIANGIKEKNNRALRKELATAEATRDKAYAQYLEAKAKCDDIQAKLGQ
jgi:hypothetical protein